jgi:hypothetical protein
LEKEIKHHGSRWEEVQAFRPCSQEPRDEKFSLPVPPSKFAS